MTTTILVQQNQTTTLMPQVQTITDTHLQTISLSIAPVTTTVFSNITVPPIYSNVTIPATIYSTITVPSTIISTYISNNTITLLSTLQSNSTVIQSVPYTVNDTIVSASPTTVTQRTTIYQTNTTFLPAITSTQTSIQTLCLVTGKEELDILPVIHLLMLPETLETATGYSTFTQYSEIVETVSYEFRYKIDVW